MQAEKNIVAVGDKRFRLYIKREELKETVEKLADEVSRDYAGVKDGKGRGPLLLPVLNGAYMFAADFSRSLAIDAEIAFVKMTSYEGTASTGKLHTIIGFPDDMRGRHVIILEDLVDTGISMGQVLRQLKGLDVASVRICTLLFKPGKFHGDFALDYVGRRIDNDFIIGYGMDYNDYGRLYQDIYIITE